MRKKIETRQLITALLSAVAVIALIYLAQRLLIPKYVDDIVEGGMVSEYYDEKDKSFDVIFIGDCEVYENFSPVTLWENYGINSYIRGSAEQYIFQSYYMLEDTLRYSRPKVVVFNIQSLQFDESRSEAYNRMTIDGMKWSGAKLGCIKASMTDEEHLIEYIFPILRFHSRWNELTSADVEYMFRHKKVTHNGYYMRVDALPAGDMPPVKPLGDYSFGDRAWEYLDKIRTCCEDNNIELLLIKAPSLYPYWYPQWDEQVKEYADMYGLKYINFLDEKDAIGIDYNTDTYDGGLHMNLSGAVKCSDYIGPILRNEYEVPDRRDDEALASIWADKIRVYNEDIDYQKEQYGIE